MTDVDSGTKPMTVATLSDGDHDKFAHIVVPSSAVTASYITGCEITALCGKKWVPTRNPELFEVCPSCAEILNAARQAG